MSEISATSESMQVLDRQGFNVLIYMHVYIHGSLGRDVCLCIYLYLQSYLIIAIHVCGL